MEAEVDVGDVVVSGSLYQRATNEVTVKVVVGLHLTLPHEVVPEVQEVVVVPHLHLKHQIWYYIHRGTVTRCQLSTEYFPLSFISATEVKTEVSDTLTPTKSFEKLFKIIVLNLGSECEVNIPPGHF